MNALRYGAAPAACKRGQAAAVVAMLFVIAQPVGAQDGETVTVAALGDSLTQGYGLPPEDGFVPRLEAWLEANDVAAEVVNAGVSGDTTAGGLARVDWTLTADVDAMIVALGGNDLLRGIDPAASRANLDGILQAAEARDVPVLLVGLRAPGNYGPAYKEAFDAIFPELAAEYDALHYESFLAPLEAEQAATGQAVRRYMQPDGIHPNAQGVALIVEAMGPSVADLVERAEAP